MQVGQRTFDVIDQGNDFVQAAHLENIQHGVLGTDQNGFAAFGTRRFSGYQQDAQTCAAEVIQPGDVQHHRGARSFEQSQHFPLSGWGITGIQAALRRKNTRRVAHWNTCWFVRGTSYYAHIV